MADDFTTNADGTVTFVFDDQHFVLRRPKLGEYRKLIESLTVAGGEAKGDVTKQFDAVAGWFQQIFETLGDKTLPPIDDLPAWLLGAEVAQELIAHWQLVPSRRGGG